MSTPTKPRLVSSSPSRAPTKRDAVFRGKTVYVPPPPDAPAPGGAAPGVSSATQAALRDFGSLAAKVVSAQTQQIPSGTLPAPASAPAPAPAQDASTFLPTPGNNIMSDGGAMPDDAGGAPDEGIDNADYGQEGGDEDMTLAEESLSDDSLDRVPMDESQESDSGDSGGMDGLDVLGTIVGADAGYSLPELWKIMNAMKPMSKADADRLLSAGISADQLAAKYLSGSDAKKAADHLDALNNTRVSVSNANGDPLSEGVASGVRQMTADAFTHANTFYNENQEGAAHLDALFSDLKNSAVSLPGEIATAVQSAGRAVWSGVVSVGTAIKYVAIGGVVLVLVAGGVFVYRRVRS